MEAQEKQPLDTIKDKVLKMKDSPTREKILKDIEEKKKHKTITK